jgi:hypothetical protein
MNYHNTTDVEGDLKALYEAKARTQDQIVRVLLGRHNTLTGSQIFNIMQNTEFAKCPVTSWRRALSNLKRADCAEKTLKKSTGMYGSPECHYIGIPESANTDTCPVCGSSRLLYFGNGKHECRKCWYVWKTN